MGNVVYYVLIDANILDRGTKEYMGQLSIRGIMNDSESPPDAAERILGQTINSTRDISIVTARIRLQQYEIIDNVEKRLIFDKTVF
jgi:hypothetical protein